MYSLRQYQGLLASAFRLLLPKDLHISWYLCKSSKDIYHNAKQTQEEAQSFFSSKNSKPIVTLAILKCAARDTIQAIGPHEEIVWSSGFHQSYHIQVIAMENYLDHQAPACVSRATSPRPGYMHWSKNQGTTPITWPRLHTTWIHGRLVQIHPSTNLQKPPSSGTLVLECTQY